MPFKSHFIHLEPWRDVRMNTNTIFQANAIGTPISNQKNNSYNQYFQNKQQNNYDHSLQMKKRNSNSGVEVTSYTDKEGRVHKTFTGKGTDTVESMKQSVSNKKDNEPKIKKRLDYSYQRVSNQVIMAKNGLSASKAVLAARRSLADLKRKLKTADCSEDEKQAALAHANSMLRIAKKKKRNLEMEELIKNTMQTDERNEKSSEALENISYSFGDDDTDEKKEKEDVIQELVGSGMKETSDSSGEKNIENMGDFSGESSEELSEEMASLMEEIPEDLMDDMNESLDELMDVLEIINPHMDKEQFEKLKTKHRCEEQKEIVKADMEYLKEYIKMVQNEQSSSASGSREDAMQGTNAEGFMSFAGGMNIPIAETFSEIGTTMSLGFCVEA